MIDEKKLKELRADSSRHKVPSCNFCRAIPEVLDTLSAALKVVRASQWAFNSSWATHPLLKGVYEALAPFEEGK